MLPHVRRYAEDQDVFFAEFKAAYEKLLALGTPAPPQSGDLSAKEKARWVVTPRASIF